eukprot:s246_g10.t1
MRQEVLVPKFKQCHQAFQIKSTLEVSSMEVAKQQIKGLGGGIFYNHFGRRPLPPILQGFLKIFEACQHGW